MDEATNLAEKAKSVLLLAGKRAYNQKRISREEESIGIGSGNEEIAFLFPTTSEKEKAPLAAEFLKQTAQALTLYAEAIDKGHVLSHEEETRLLIIEHNLDPKLSIICSLHLMLGKKDYTTDRIVEREDGQKVRIQSVSNEKYHGIEGKLCDFFNSKEIVDLGQFPYPRFSADHVREVARSASEYFEKYREITKALKQQGIEIEGENLF